MTSTRTLLKLSLWALLTTALFAAPSEAQTNVETVYLLERNLVVTGADRAEARLKLWDEAQRVTEAVRSGVGHYGSILLHDIAPSRRLDGEPYRVGTSVRFLIRTVTSSSRPRSIPVLKNATVLEPETALVMRLRASGSPDHQDVRFTLVEIQHLVRRSVPTNVGGAALLQHAWRKLLGDRPDDGDPLSAQAAVRIPYRNGHMEFPFDVDRLDTLLGRANPSSLHRLTADEAKALSNAFDLLIDPNVESSLRKTLLRLRWRPLPYGPEARTALDALVDEDPEPVAPAKSAGLLGGV